MEMESDISENEACNMLQDTSKLIAMERAGNLEAAAAAYKLSNAVAENVGFWDWMNQNYSGANGHMFSNNVAMKNYISGGKGKEEWLYKQLQGKGYEWDWMQAQRHNIKNILRQYDAGIVSNQPGFDVTEKSILSGQETKYQMKAYTSKKNPDLHNTGTDIKVVTNSEKAGAVRQKGYQVEEFKNREEIIYDTDKRMQQIKDGDANPHYGFKNAGTAMLKAGVIGCVIGMGTETISSYKLWKKGDISDTEYLSEVLKAGGDSGITTAVTAGVMIPVSAAVTAAGISSLITIPVAVIVSDAVNKVIAPCFGRGQYREILGQAKYYQQLEDVYDSFINIAEYASNEYTDYIDKIKKQSVKHEQMKQKSMLLNKELKNLYDLI